MYDNIIDKLHLIKGSIAHIEEYSEMISSPDEFLLSPGGMLRLDACVMRLQVIGESVKSILSTKNNPLSYAPEIPWKKIVALRNIISHEYISIDEELIYNIIKDDLPQLKVAVETIILRLETEE